MKCKDSIRESNKNSYFTKYVEEYNKTKINNKKNYILKSSKVKKKKNNSVNKNQNKYKIGSYSFNINKKKSERNVIDILNENNIDNNLNKKIDAIIPNNDNNNKINIPNIENLSTRENAYLILSYSKCLRLCERMIFSRSSSKLRESLSKQQILEVNKLYLNEKLKELEKKIEICDEKAKNKFVASKTAEMTLNFITNEIENEFKLNLFQNLEEENEKKYCFNFVKFLYLLLDEDYENINENNLLKDLYQKINNKGFSNIKDYIYFIYIKNSKENKIIENIDKINEIISEVPDLLNYSNIVKWDKFILYSYYLFKEIVNYGNEQIDAFNLEKDCLNLVDIINNKLNLYNEKNAKKINFNK